MANTTEDKGIRHEAAAPKTLGMRLLAFPARMASNAGPEFVALFIGVAAWEVAGRALQFMFFPPLSQVLVAWWELFQQGKIVANLAASLTALAIGFGIALVTGIGCGTLMGRYRKVEYFLDPFLDMKMATPSMALLPVFFVLFGISDLTRVAIVWVYSWSIITVNTIAGIRSCTPSLLEMASSFGARERDLIWKILLPSALPLIMAGVRLGIARAVKGMINGEMFIALVGLGALIRIYGSAFAVDKLLALLLTIVAVAVIASAMVQWLDRRITFWAHL